MKFKILYGLGGAINEETIEAENEDQAENEAFLLACACYEQYEGMHGLRSVEDIMEEEDLEYNDAYIEWEQERESWLVCSVGEIIEY